MAQIDQADIPGKCFL